MMNFLGTILGLLSIAVFIWACFGLFASARARLSSRWKCVLAWEISVLFGISGNMLPDDPDSTPASHPVPAVTPSERTATSSAETPCTPAKLSPAAVELVRLYEELHTFKDVIEFLHMGFSQAGPYYAWMEAMKAHQGRTGIELLDKVGFLPGEVMILGMDYMSEYPSEGILGVPRPTAENSELAVILKAPGNPPMSGGCPVPNRSLAKRERAVTLRRLNGGSQIGMRRHCQLLLGT